MNQPISIVSFESRMALPTERLIEKQGFKAIVAPSMKEVPVEKSSHLIDFYNELKSNKIDVLVLMTGVGLRTFIKTISEQFPTEEIIKTLSEIKICVRGPKPTAVCKMNNIPIAMTAGQPNTWREIIEVMDTNSAIRGMRVGILEYGVENVEFYKELTMGGAKIHPICIYKWELPDDIEPLKNAINVISKNEADIVLFTSAQQVNHLFQIAIENNQESALRKGFYSTVIGSIGPVCSERLREYQIFPDFEANPNKLDELVKAANLEGSKILPLKKEKAKNNLVRISENFNQSPSSLKSACQMETNKKIPCWLMRQAGRYMAEYQMVRQKTDFMTLCQTSELVSEVTISAVERLGVDAAIIFSDILVPLVPMGLNLTYEENQGPHIHNPVRNENDVEKLKTRDITNSLNYVYESIRLTRNELHSRIPLIGFSGAPFTMASYMIEGGGSKTYELTKKFMKEKPDLWDDLLNKLAGILSEHLNKQIEAGCQVVQIFDSWVSCLTADEYEKYVLKHTQSLIQKTDRKTPLIHFGSFRDDMIDLQIEAGGDIFSLHWQTSLKKSLLKIPDTKGLQGNLNPHILFEDKNIIKEEVFKILDLAGNRKGFIFNLGHGILPQTPVDNVIYLVDLIHDWKIG